MRQWLGNFVGYDTRFFPKVSPMLGFSFSFSFAAGERYVVLDGDGKEGKKEGRKEERKEGRKRKRRKGGRKEGRKEGREEGRRKEGRRKGKRRKEGRKKGREEGRGGANSLRTASPGGSETACWTEGKPWK